VEFTSPSRWIDRETAILLSPRGVNQAEDHRAAAHRPAPRSLPWCARSSPGWRTPRASGHSRICTRRSIDASLVEINLSSRRTGASGSDARSRWTTRTLRHQVIAGICTVETADPLGQGRWRSGCGTLEGSDGYLGGGAECVSGRSGSRLAASHGPLRRGRRGRRESRPPSTW